MQLGGFGGFRRAIADSAIGWCQNLVVHCLFLLEVPVAEDDAEAQAKEAKHNCYDGPT